MDTVTVFVDASTVVLALIALAGAFAGWVVISIVSKPGGGYEAEMRDPGPRRGK